MCGGGEGVNYPYFKYGHTVHNLSQKSLALKALMKLSDLFFMFQQKFINILYLEMCIFHRKLTRVFRSCDYIFKYLFAVLTIHFLTGNLSMKIIIFFCQVSKANNGPFSS